MIMNKEPVDIYVEGYADGEEYELEKVIAKYGHKEVLRVYDKQEHGLLANTELSEAILSQSIKTLCTK
jgi:hypothetical protein